MKVLNPYFSTELTDKVLPAYLSTIHNQRTAEGYVGYIRLICNYLQKDFLDITETDAEKYNSYLYGQYCLQNLSRKTINVRFSCYRSFGRFISDNNLRENYTNPFLRIERAPVDDSVAISNVPSMQELDQIMSACTDRMMYLVLALAGRAAFSLTNILRIHIQNIKVDEESVRIIFPAKDDFSLPEIHNLPKDVAGLLLDYLKEHYVPCDESGHLFYNQHRHPLTARNVDAAVERIVRNSGVAHRYTLKDIRARAIVDMKNAGLEWSQVAEYVGIKVDRAKMYAGAANAAKSCPADLVNYSLKTKDD